MNQNVFSLGPGILGLGFTAKLACIVGLAASCGSADAVGSLCPALGTSSPRLLVDCTAQPYAGVAALFGPPADGASPVLATSITWDEQEPFTIFGATRLPGMIVTVNVQRVGGGSDWIGLGHVTSDEDGLWEFEVSYEDLPPRWNERVFQPTETGFFLVLGVFTDGGSLPPPGDDYLTVLIAS